MILAFEHYQSEESRLGTIIKAWEKYPYIHVELIFESKDWLCFSARTREDGVFMKPFEDVVKTLDHWKGYRLPVAIESPSFEAAMSLVGKEFGYANIANSLVLKNFKTDPDRRFCSQSIYEVLTQTTDLPLFKIQSSRVTPKMLHQWVLQLGYPEISLVK